METLELYTFSKSSATYRVRIALNYKGIDYQPHYIDLTKGKGENFEAEYMSINTQGFVPTLVNGDNVLQQSMAILEYLEEKHPTPAMLPVNPEDRAYVRAITNMIACDIHPLNNLRVLHYIENDLNLEVEQKLEWYRHWIREGFTALENFLLRNKKHGQYCFGDDPSLADACLVPQVYNAYRYQCDMDDYPAIRGINEHCQALVSFRNAAPEKQQDFVR